MSPPKVSVLMATYNRAHFLDHAIEALRTQSFEDWELVIPDDGSTDRTHEVARVWSSRDSRIVYLRHDDNVGISANYNRGLAKARGEYIAMLDDDDEWCHTDKLARQVEFLDRHSDYVGCGGGLIVIDPEGRERYRFLKPEKDDQIRRAMLLSNPMANSTTLFRREVGERVGWYDDSIRYSGDRDFWMKMGLAGKLCNFPEYLSWYTMGEHNTSITNMRPHLKISLMLTRRYRKEYPGYPKALAFNCLQYGYSLLPRRIHGRIHTTAAQLKRRTVG